MIDMVEMSLDVARWLRLLLMLGLASFMLASDFILLVVTYLVVASVAPDVLGEVAVHPFRFAAWIVLVKLPMMLAHMLATTWRGWMVVPVTRGEFLDHPVRKRWRRALDRGSVWGADVASSAIAALVVFHRMADPGDIQVWPLVAVTAIGPFLLLRPAVGLFRLLRQRVAPH